MLGLSCIREVVQLDISEEKEILFFGIEGVASVKEVSRQPFVEMLLVVGFPAEVAFHVGIEMEIAESKVSAQPHPDGVACGVHFGGIGPS